MRRWKSKIECKDTGEIVQGYEKYLSTRHWRETRKRIYVQRGCSCECCGQKLKIYHVHHLTYKHIGNEPDEDLKLLCEYCHNKEHGMKKEKPKAEKSRVATQRRRLNDAFNALKYGQRELVVKYAEELRSAGI